MALVDRGALCSLLLKEDPPKGLVTDVMGHLGHFFVAAESGKYPLGSVGDVDLEAVKTAVMGVTGNNVTRIIPISISSLFPWPEWMGEDAYKAILRDSLKVSFRQSLEDILRYNFWVRVGDSLKDDLRNNLWDSLKVSLESSLSVILDDSLRDSLRDSLGDSIWISLFYALEFVLAGQEEQARKFFALLDAWNGILILGEKGDEPGVWLILVA
ncbi:hypothetical protein CL629_01855 [bacterium]|nr:hypothetical protein [bacterium]|tara:strand:- start:1600 stop:2238 length:639 start_codon:yes stop_codon:yes gene_type:complete